MSGFVCHCYSPEERVMCDDSRCATGRGEAAAMTPTLLLTAEERERFAAWLEADAQADEMLAERMSEVLQGAAASAMAAERRADVEA